MVAYGILTFFAGYRALLKGSFASIVNTGMHVIWWVQYCTVAMGFITAGHLLEQASQTTIGLLGVALTKQRDIMVAKKIRAFMFQIGHNSTRITTFFFVVDLSVIATVTTFLFMLIQFDN
ncbi:uncharacterized protein LOC129774281 [Toxorhynchites rutilus septentrionalis]|uniref:uncharacterized protein LOC129774281 n=1 Tax=Toxorhynchites rutilus septentrionalis TaxID=329112 RepID=UPI0024786DFF|nr:uncharacterized protein LOC129774281 [Toxorhynchites rutilus septentrionalis]